MNCFVFDNSLDWNCSGNSSGNSSGLFQYCTEAQNGNTVPVPVLYRHTLITRLSNAVATSTSANVLNELYSARV